MTSRPENKLYLIVVIFNNSTMKFWEINEQKRKITPYQKKEREIKT